MADSSVPRRQEQRRIEAERRLVRAAAELVGEIAPARVPLANAGEFRDAVVEESQADSPIDQLRQLIDFYFRVVSDLQPVNRARLVLWAEQLLAAHLGVPLA